ncbi:MAG: outer membrane protein assembly factor BamE [Alphaproteobacteria bacterium]|nr:outer membrane protein assembly factor BamE [Alphaproteobacteria bacterium]
MTKLTRSLRPAALVAAMMAGAVTLSACAGPSLTQIRTQGYDIPDDALDQIRPGVSKDFVEIVLGTPQTTNTLNSETAFYYVETVVESTAFGLTSIKERTVLAIYFDNKDRVTDKAIYSLQDGKVFNVVGRRTPGFGTDKSFVESLLGSLAL